MCQLRDLHVIGIEQFSRSVIETGHGELIVDFRLQQAQLGIRQLRLRFQDKEDSLGAQFIFALFRGQRLFRKIQGFLPGGDAQFCLLELVDRVADVKRHLLTGLALGVQIAATRHQRVPTYYAQLSLTLPLKNRAAKAEMGNALVSRRSDLYTERQTREQVALDVSNAVHQLEQAKLSIAAGKESLDLAKKTLAAEQRKYELGSETIFFVLEAQTELANAELSLLQAEVNYQLAVAGLDHATGELLDPYHVQIAELTH